MHSPVQRLLDGSTNSSQRERGFFDHLPLPHRPTSSPYLVEKQGLADIAPATGASSRGEQGSQQTHEEQGATSRAGTNEEHHEQAGGHPQQAGVPGEQAEGGAAGMEGRRDRNSGRAARKAAVPSPTPEPESSLLLSGDTDLSLSPEVGGRGPLQAQAGQVHGSIGHQVEDSDHSGQCVQLPSQEHQLGKGQEACRCSKVPVHPQNASEHQRMPVYPQSVNEPQKVPVNPAKCQCTPKCQ